MVWKQQNETQRRENRIDKETQRVFSAVFATLCFHRLRYTLLWLFSKGGRGEHISRCQPLRQRGAEGELQIFFEKITHVIRDDDGKVIHWF
jgi:hypothetical protein